MILNEAIQRVQSMYSKGVQSASSRLRSRHIYSALKSARATLIRQQYNKGQLVSQFAYQYLSCVELENAPLHECPCAPLKGCIFLRTKNPLPSPITSLDSHLIQAVTTIDGGTRFDSTTFEAIKWTKGNKYTSRKQEFFIKNRRLYITDTHSLKIIALAGLFADPVEAHLFQGSCSNTACVDVTDIDFPIDETLADPMYKMAFDELIILFKQMGEDRSTDSADDSDTAGSMIHQSQPQQGQDD